MKAVILSGGEGTRGKPFTNYFPKAMIPINGKPLIDYIVNYLSGFDLIDEIIILADYKKLGGQIKNYFEGRKMTKNLTFVQDSQSGTGGDLIHVSRKLKGDSDFILWFVDNFCAIDLQRMYSFYRKKNSLGCIAVRRFSKSEIGFAVIKNGFITEFQEKPMIKMHIPECLGVYILATEILSKIRSKLKKKKRNLNLSFDILEELSLKNKLSGFDIGKTSWMDIESPITLQRNRKLIRKIIREMNI